LDGLTVASRYVRAAAPELSEPPSRAERAERQRLSQPGSALESSAASRADPEKAAETAEAEDTAAAEDEAARKAEADAARMSAGFAAAPDGGDGADAARSRSPRARSSSSSPGPRYDPADEPFLTSLGKSHTVILLRKNALIKQRQYTSVRKCCKVPIPFSLVMEFVVPIAIVLLVSWLKTLTDFDVITTGWGGDTPTHSRSTECVPGIEYYWRPAITSGAGSA
jgi:cobalamin biosynthesis Mg chelatase CobN